MTRDKQEMIFSAMTAIEQWAAEVIADPDGVLGEVAKANPGRDVFQAADLWIQVPEEIQRSAGGVTSLARALIRAGGIRGGVVRTEHGAKRLIAIRNLDFWRQRSNEHRVWAANYDGKMTVAKGRARG